MSRATSWSGLWGNLQFLIRWKTWATLAVYATGVITGAIFMASL